MNEADKQQILATWPQVQACMDQFGKEFYEFLFTTTPEYRELFRRDVSEQETMLGSTLNQIIASIDDGPRLQSLLVNLGRLHAGYGIQEEDFVVVEGAFLHAASTVLKDAWTDRVQSAYRTLYRLAGEVMIKAMRQTYRAETAQSEGWYLDYFMPRQKSDEQATQKRDNGATPVGDCSAAEKVTVVYDGEGVIKGYVSQSLLEMSQEHGIPHISECGGLAKCSTCRVEIVDGLEHCQPRNEAEKALAHQKRLPENIRLACQLHVNGPVTVKRLVRDAEDVLQARDSSPYPGRDMELAVMFCDIRNFTPFAEKNLAYDVVHMLNRYFSTLGKVVQANMGFIDKYIGDGVMVLFGLNPSRETHPCVDAVSSAVELVTAVNHQNFYFERYFGHRFNIGIGIHYGPVIIGEVGYHRKREFTALGDTVNIAARIETHTKEVVKEILISEDTYQHADKDLIRVGESFPATLKGKSEQILLRAVEV